MRSSCRGFSLLELLIALSVGVILTTMVLRVLVPALHAVVLQTDRDRARASLDLLVDRLRMDQGSAWAVFTPQRDVLGAPNSDGHEVGFFMRDSAGRSYFWSYSFDPNSQTVTRYLYDAVGATPRTDERYPGVTQFVSRTFPITALQSPAAPVYSPLYEGARLTPATVRFFGTVHPEVAGGNAVTLLQLRSAALSRDVQLVTQTAPTGFTIVLRYTPAPNGLP